MRSKNFLLFVGNRTPCGGAGDLIGSYLTITNAHRRAFNRRGGSSWAHIYDLSKGKIVWETFDLKNWRINEYRK